MYAITKVCQLIAKLILGPVNACRYNQNWKRQCESQTLYPVNSKRSFPNLCHNRTESSYSDCHAEIHGRLWWKKVPWLGMVALVLTWKSLPEKEFHSWIWIQIPKSQQVMGLFLLHNQGRYYNLLHTSVTQGRRQGMRKRMHHSDA